MHLQHANFISAKKVTRSNDQMDVHTERGILLVPSYKGFQRPIHWLKLSLVHIVSLCSSLSSGVIWSMRPTFVSQAFC